jgi:predicted Rossmann fold flavoprotein
MRDSVIIVGGGPAGLMAANVLEKHHIPYLILEKNDQLAKKLLLTGGKRCNVTNERSVAGFIEDLNMPHRKFLYHALTSFGPKEIKQFLKDRGLNLLLEEGYKYFPETHKSLSVLEALLKDLDQNKIMYQSSVKAIKKLNDGYVVMTKNQDYHASYVIVATGSNAYPTTGSSGDGIVFANHLGIKTIPFSPAETYLLSSQVKQKFKHLQGVSIQGTTLKMDGIKQLFHGDLLFTHQGLSGPVVLHASEHVYPLLEKGSIHVRISLTSIPIQDYDQSIANLLDENKTIVQSLESFTSKRLASTIIEHLHLKKNYLKELSKKELIDLKNMMYAFPIEIDSMPSIEHAFVNKGGIAIEELDQSSMEVKSSSGLYFIGEITDLQGPIGGYNLTIAFSTGHLAGESIAKKYNTG